MLVHLQLLQLILAPSWIRMSIWLYWVNMHSSLRASVGHAMSVHSALISELLPMFQSLMALSIMTVRTAGKLLFL